MKIVAHRGLWLKPTQANSIESLKTALEAGFGVETDLRSYQGQLILSHDPCAGSPLPFSELLPVILAHPECPVFLNIKEDGLAPLLTEVSKTLEKNICTFFDMSVPQLIQYSKNFPKKQLCTRLSDYEFPPSAPELADWLWIDCFNEDPSEERIQEIQVRYSEKNVCFVSPELHGRKSEPLWKKLKSLENKQRWFLCTDEVDQAQSYFGSPLNSHHARVN